jgi:hypothetical protein
MPWGKFDMQDRQDQSDVLAAQLACGGAGIAFFLAGLGSLFVNYGLAIGCYVGAIFMFWCAHKFHAVSWLMLRLPVSFSPDPQRSHTEAFLLATYASLGLSILVSAAAVPTFYAIELHSELKSQKAHLTNRHLLDDQKQRIRNGLKLGPNESFEFQINSAQNCDECEQFAEELRDFFNSIPGWKAGGGALFFRQERQLRNVQLVARDQDHLAIVDKIAKAFSDGGYRLERANEDVQPGTFVILVGRRRS